MAVERQDLDPASLLAHWRDLLAWRRRSPEIRLGALLPLDTPAPVIGFVREHERRRTTCLFNFGDEAVCATVDGETIELGPWTFRHVTVETPAIVEFAEV
jgi:alpha-glucosidase